MQVLKQWIKKKFGRWLYRAQLSPENRAAMDQHLQQWNNREAVKLSDSSFNIFTYHGEDGIIQYLLKKIQGVPPVFADIGSGDCIKSNCAALAVHYGWKGVFIDRDSDQLAVGKAFYRDRVNVNDLQLLQADVRADNINALLQQAGVGGQIGLLSVDIDGNDFWIWKAIECIQPEIVVIEAKVEFGKRSIAVPYGAANHHSAHQQYNGASVEAFCRLATTKGYKLAGANKQGYNLFFVKDQAAVAAVSSAGLLNDPDIIRSFYPDEFFNQYQFEII